MEKVELENIANSIKDLKNLPNSKLVEHLDKLSIEYEDTKTMVINLTYHLDVIEEMYNSILKEYENRNS